MGSVPPLVTAHHVEMQVDPDMDGTERDPNHPPAPGTQAVGGPDLSPYVGKWIAIRDGRVIASGDSFSDLDEGGIAGAMDAVYRVPPAFDYPQT
jgi:hypothetical protein